MSQIFLGQSAGPLRQTGYQMECINLQTGTGTGIDVSGHVTWTGCFYLVYFKPGTGSILTILFVTPEVIYTS